jgi:hypothetical protein
MLCAAWELYVEELLVESAEVLSTRASSPSQLPFAVQKEIAEAVRESKHELKPLEMAGDGWQHVYISHVTLLASGLNSPKSTVVDPLFERLTGTVEIWSAWSVSADTVNDFVKARGEIAHRGRAAAYVTISWQPRSRQAGSMTTSILGSDPFALLAALGLALSRVRLLANLPWSIIEARPV